jgi:hypothetical protein
MNKIILNIQNQIRETIGLCMVFFKEINLPTALLVFLLLYIFIIRKWTFKKFLSCFLTMFFLLILYVRVAAFLNTALDPESKNLLLPIAQTVCLIIAAIVFIYHAAVKE